MSALDECHLLDCSRIIKGWRALKWSIEFSGFCPMILWLLSAKLISTPKWGCCRDDENAGLYINVYRDHLKVLSLIDQTAVIIIIVLRYGLQIRFVFEWKRFCERRGGHGVACEKQKNIHVWRILHVFFAPRARMHFLWIRV